MIKVSIAILGLVVGCTISSIITAYLINERKDEKPSVNIFDNPKLYEFLRDRRNKRKELIKKEFSDERD